MYPSLFLFYQGEQMQPLTVVCAEKRCDYMKARLALIRGEIRGELRGRRWFCDPRSLAEWKANQPWMRRNAKEPASAA